MLGRKLGVLAAAAAVLLVAPAAPARTNDRAKPIVFVHGLDAFGCAGNDGNGTWNDMINTLTAWGWTGAKVKLGYYECDTGQNDMVDHHGSHATHFGGSGEHVSGGAKHGSNTQIDHLGYHWAWYVYDHYSAGGVCIDAVGHSMGGLIIRYGMARTAQRHTDFPPSLCVEDILTIGTPHSGTGWASGCWWSDQCNQMVPGSGFLNWLASNAQNPQGSGGTDWTNMGSDSDGVVSASSSYGMSAAHRVVYLSSMGIGHSDYMHKTSDSRTADVDYWDTPGPWYRWLDAPYCVRWGDFALLYGTW